MDKKFLQAYFIAGPQDFPDLSLKESAKKISQIIRSGVTAYQFRDKGTIYASEVERLELAQYLHQACQEVRVPFIVNDDVNLALLSRAEGIHVGQEDEALQNVHDRVGANMFVGLSVRNQQELDSAQTGRPDYIGIGPIFPTQSKIDAAQAIGLENLKKILVNNHLPTVGIGGITINHLKHLAEVGLDGVAVISLLSQAKNPSATILEIKKVFNK